MVCALEKQKTELRIQEKETEIQTKHRFNLPTAGGVHVGGGDGPVLCALVDLGLDLLVRVHGRTAQTLN